MAAWQGWEAQVLRASGLPTTARNVQLLRGWQASEGGGATYNPLNTTTHQAGSTAYNSNGGNPVQNFRTPNDGVRATVKTLFNGHYGPILAALKQGNADPRTIGQAVDSSPWGTHGGLIDQWSGGVGPAPSTANGIPHTLQGGVSQMSPNLQGAQRALALQLLNRSDQYLHAGGKAIAPSAVSLVNLIKDRNMAQQMSKLGDQSGIQFQDHTGGAAASNPNAPGVVNLAKQYIGTKYVFGGTTPQGFDCSGFVQYVYGHKGINLPRTSQEQFHVGQAVDPANLRPGDLVFFAGSDGTVANPGHEGMYIGNGQMISAPHTGDVVHISNLDTSAAAGFSGARRVA